MSTRTAPATDFEALFRDLGPVLWRSIYAYSAGDAEIADDAVAESFARAMESRKPIRHPRPWLFTTAFRIAAGELRRRRRDPPPALASDAEIASDPGLGGVVEALRQLSPAQRAAVYLRDVADLPGREVAALMGTSESAVRVHLYRARRRLRTILGDDEGANDDA
ncbi:MAG TPA: RNA polymerase sigma factor [Actinomycetota bacterium]